MSAVKWIVEPVFLNRKPLPPDKADQLSSDLDMFANLSMCSLIRQLSSLALIANSVFSEIATECELINERTGKLKSKISSVQSITETLNAKAKKVRKYNSRFRLILTPRRIVLPRFDTKKCFLLCNYSADFCSREMIV